MSKFSKTSLLLSLASLVTFTGPIFGEEMANSEAQNILKKANYQLSDTSPPFKLAPAEPISPLQFAFANYTINYHVLSDIKDHKTVQIEDGSCWEVPPYEAYVIKSWRLGDLLEITPNYNRWFNSYEYYITNKTNNTYVKVKFCLGPRPLDPCAYWIANVDYFGGYVLLQNNSVWTVNPDDFNTLKSWAANDYVVFGNYNTLFSDFDHILININMKTHVRVKQY